MKPRLITRELAELREWARTMERRAAVLAVAEEIDRELTRREERWFASELRARGWGQPALRKVTNDGEHAPTGELTERKDEP